MIKLPKINAAKAAKASLPYVVMGVLVTKLGEAYRLTSGGDVLFSCTPERGAKGINGLLLFLSHAPSPHI